jgi:hypothetical protein
MAQFFIVIDAGVGLDDGGKGEIKMEGHIKAWLEDFDCASCFTEVGSKRRAGVLVVVQDHPGDDPEIIPFCYKHAGIYMSRYSDRPSLIGIRDALFELERAVIVLGRALMGAVARGVRRGA